MKRMGNKLVDALVLGGGNRNDRNTEHGFHFVDADRAAVLAHLVHHIQRENHGDIQLHELHGQVEVALDVGGVDDVDDAAGLILQNKAAGDNFLAGIGRHGVDAGQVGDERIVMTANRAVLPVHGHAGEIADVLIGAGELVEEGRLAAVLIAGKGKGERRSFGQGMFACFDVVASALA